jgi:hypothetical protein
MVLVACGSVAPAERISRSGRSDARVLLRGLSYPQAYAAGGQLYVAQQVNRPGGEVRSELMRVDPGGGGVRAVLRDSAHRGP